LEFQIRFCVILREPWLVLQMNLFVIWNEPRLVLQINLCVIWNETQLIIQIGFSVIMSEPWLVRHSVPSLRIRIGVGLARITYILCKYGMIG
jgi:hypothetical protein